MGKGNTKGIAISGIISALIILSLYGGVIIINNKMFFMALAVALEGIPYAINGIGMGILVYAASSILSVLLLPNKVYALVFVFLGIYPLVKLISESKNILTELIFKVIWFNGTLILMYFVLKNFIQVGNFFNTPASKILLLAAANIIFIIYDYIFSKFIMFVFDRIIRNK